MDTYTKGNRFVSAYEKNFLATSDVKRVIHNLNKKSELDTKIVGEISRSWMVATAGTFDNQVELIGCRQAIPHSDMKYAGTIFITLSIIAKGLHMFRIDSGKLDVNASTEINQHYYLCAGSLLIFDPSIPHMLYDDRSVGRNTAPKGWAALQLVVDKRDFKAIKPESWAEYTRTRFSEFLA